MRKIMLAMYSQCVYKQQVAVFKHWKAVSVDTFVLLKSASHSLCAMARQDFHYLSTFVFLLQKKLAQQQLETYYSYFKSKIL